MYVYEPPPHNLVLVPAITPGCAIVELTVAEFTVAAGASPAKVEPLRLAKF